jgi:hypothetical protein
VTAHNATLILAWGAIGSLNDVEERLRKEGDFLNAECVASALAILDGFDDFPPPDVYSMAAEQRHRDAQHQTDLALTTLGMACWGGDEELH